MDKRKLQHFERKIKLVKPWYFLVAAAFFALLAIHGLRQNNFKMIELRDAVVKADQENGDVEKALQQLRSHVHGHMNTNLSSGNFAIKPPIQLKARYERLTAQNQEKVKQANIEINAKGEALCAAQFPAGGLNPPRVACLQDYMAVNAVKSDPVPDELYKFDFVSPSWSPDLAGWSIVLSVLSLVLFSVRVALGRITERLTE